MGRPTTQDGSLTLFTLINGLYFIMLAELFLGDPLSLDITQAQQEQNYAEYSYYNKV